MKSLNTNASIYPIGIYIFIIFMGGALYTLFFLEVLFPTLVSRIPAMFSDYTVVILMGLYGIPIMILLGASFWLIKQGQKRGVNE